MVVAGIYMVSRLCGVFWEGLSIGTSSINLLALVGGVTVLGGAGWRSCSTTSSRSSRTPRVAAGRLHDVPWVWAPGRRLFHLFTRVLQGLPVPRSGSVSHSVHSFDMQEMGGLRKLMPQTYKTFIIATAALIGIFPLAGFWSKDEILAGAIAARRRGNYRIFMAVGIIGALMTNGLHGPVRVPHLLRRVPGSWHPHESGPRIVVPLWILATLASSPAWSTCPRRSPRTAWRCGSSTSTSPRALLPDGPASPPRFSSPSRWAAR